MANQDPCPESIATDSGHGTLAIPIKTDPETEVDILARYGSDIKWKEGDPSIEFDDDNITMDQTPAASSHPVQASTGSQVLSPPESPGCKKLCLWELTAAEAHDIHTSIGTEARL